MNQVLKLIHENVPKSKRKDIINKDNKLGRTPLYIAARNGHKEIINELNEMGVDINKANNKQATPFYIAVQNGHKDIVVSLKEMGADKDFFLGHIRIREVFVLFSFFFF